LIPLYAGYPADRIHLGQLFHWYRDSLAAADRVLGTVALMPSPAIWLLTTMVIAAAVVLALVLSTAK
jgi:hypothetical protein